MFARSLSGRVTDLQGNPIVFATLAVDKGKARCSTDEAGLYKILIPDAAITVNVSADGYESLKKCFPAGKTDITADFTLDDSGKLEELTVYGKNNRQRLRESEFNVNSVDVKSMINTTATISDLVARTSGVRIRTNGGVGSDFDVSLNGLNGNAVRYFVDGVPMEVLGSQVNLSNIPANNIERVDIYKGVVPAFLGTDAMCGAINIITRNMRKSFVDASISAGSFGTFAADFSAQSVIPHTDIIVRASAGYKSSKNDYLMKGVEVWDKDADQYITTNRRRFHDHYRSLVTRLEAGVQGKPWAKTLFLSLGYSNANKEIQTGSVQAIVYGTPRRKGHSFTGALTYSIDNLLTPGLDFSLNASHTADRSLTVDTVFRKYSWDGSWIPTQRNEISGGAKSLLHYSRPLTVANANLVYKFLDIHTLSLNYSLNLTGNKRYDDLDKEYQPSKDILAKHITSLSYAQNLLDGKLCNTAFGKNYTEGLTIKQMTDHWNTDTKESHTRTYWGYGIGSRYAIMEELQLKASFEHAVRLPLSREALGNGSTVIANLNLKPESSDNVNVGMFGNLNPWRQHRFYYEVAAYLRNVKDMIHLLSDEASGISQYSNISSVKVYGLEGEIGWHFADMLHLTTNWSWSVSRDMNRYRGDGKPSVTYKNRIPNIPWLYGNSELTFIHRNIFSRHDRVRAGYNFSYVHWFYLTWEGYGSLSSKSKIPSQNDHSIYLTYSWKNERYNVTAEINNIFDATLYDNYKLQKPGRSVMFKFHLYID